MLDTKPNRIALLMILSLQAAFILPAPATGQEIPTSRRARNAIARVRPVLERDLAESGLTLGSRIFIRIFKESEELEVWVRGPERFQLFRTYDICSHSGDLGPKLRSGDMQSPEGFYFVPPQALNPASRFHLSFNLGFPNAYDRYHERTGSYLMVHGACVSIGCYAMTDKGIEEIYALADAAFRKGQPFFRVHIFPFRMTPEAMGKHSDSDWVDFWRNLRTGYDFFEEKGIPPRVKVRGGRYVFEEP